MKTSTPYAKRLTLFGTGLIVVALSAAAVSATPGISVSTNVDDVTVRVVKAMPSQQQAMNASTLACLDEQGIHVDTSRGGSLATSVPVRYGEQFNQCQAEALAETR